MYISIFEEALISIDIVVVAIIAPQMMKVRDGSIPILKHILGSAKIPAPNAVAIRAKIDPRNEPGPRLLNDFCKKFVSIE